MQTNIDELRTIMKSSGLPVYRDSAPTTAKYPYIVYEYVEEVHKRTSNKVLEYMPLYQVAVITNGVESDYKPLRAALENSGVSFSSFRSYPYDENDNTVLQFITNVRCIE